MHALATDSTAARRADAAARRIAACALRSLHAELALYPKPGLVSLRDSGAHDDMDARTFVRSMLALRAYFPAIASAGANDAPFSDLRKLGVAAEQRMLRATGGINTHRGAIFALGLLAAAAGNVAWRREAPTDRNLSRAIARWRSALTAAPVDAQAPPSHGRLVARDHGAGGARAEAADGFPAVFAIGLPALRHALDLGAGVHGAQVHAFFALLAHVTDTNLIYRGGPAGLAFVRGGASEFIAAGSVFARGWRRRARRLHRQCCERRLSPGGSADLWSACWFVHLLQRA